MDQELFPLGIAVGAAHCNRELERKRLAGNVLHARHTWLAARRRMGKTSLIEQVASELRRRRPPVVAVTIDLMVIHDAQALETRIRQAVSEAVAQLASRNQRVFDQLVAAFTALRPEISLGTDGVKLTLGSGANPAATVEAALAGLDALALKRKRRVMFVCDEFQQLTALKEHASLEGAIRHAAERARHLAFVFSGSRRHLLSAMFEDPDRPLYRLCERMPLERIGADHYSAFLADAAKARWGKPLSDEAVSGILGHTLRHPYYLNALCGRLWIAPRPPTAPGIDAAWARYVAEDKDRAAARIIGLSPAQRAMLAGIAREPTPHPTGQHFLSGLRLATSTGLAAKEVLEREDFIQQNEAGMWELVEPMLAAYLRSI